MQYTNLIWRDGQPYSEMFDDIYYSSSQSESISGESEFNHVFFKNNGLPGRWKSSKNFVIAELGFGSGLNCILTIREWLKHLADSKQEKCLHYIAIEKYPLSPEAIIEIVSRYPELEEYCEELLVNYPPAIEGVHSRHLFDSRVIIHYNFMDAYDALKDEDFSVDAWYLDGFSPAKNSDMWSEQLFEKIAQNSHHDASCSTYTSAGFVKRNLQKAGFDVSKVTGYGKKREMLVGKYSAVPVTPLKYKDKPWFKSALKKELCEKKVTIIGAGIAGLSLAYSLVQRGWLVTIIDKHGGIAKETSSNPAAIVYPRLSVNNDVDTEFYTTAYCYAVSVYKNLQEKSQQRFWFDDGLQQVMDEKRITHILQKFDFNSDFISFTNGQNGEQVTVDYKSAGVVIPAILCDVLKNECNKKLKILDAQVTRIHFESKKWQCFSGSQLINESEVLVIANGTAINELGLSLRFPVEAIRGQVVELNANPVSRQIKKTLNADVHVTPVINGKHYLGASYTRNSEALDIDEYDNRELLESVNRIYPGMFTMNDYCDAWVGFRAISKDRVPVVGALPDEKFFNEEYADICHGNINKEYQSARYLNGLYISAAHGSRGFCSSVLCAEIIAAQIEGEPMPARKRVLDYLSPSRFVVNKLKQR